MLQSLTVTTPRASEGGQVTVAGLAGLAGGLAGPVVGAGLGAAGLQAHIWGYNIQSS